jgi:hypothetical protein
MTSKSLLTATILVFATLAFAQGQQQGGIALFNTNKPTAKERGLKSLEERHNFKFPEKNLPAKQKSQSKSASNFSARLDSLISEGWYKHEWAYDGSGNETLSAISYWQSDGTWRLEEHVITEYNDDDLPIEKIGWGLNFLNYELQENFRETFTYQENYLPVETTRYNRVSDEWIPLTKVVNEYDDQENLTRRTNFSWSQGTESLSPIAKQDYFYNEAGGLIEFLRSGWNNWNNEWSNIIREIHTVNADNNPLSVIGYLWEPGEETWESNYSGDYTYNAAGSETEVIYSTWYESEEAFSPSAKNARAYDDSNNLLSEEFSYWNEAESGWIGDFLDMYEYDEAENISALIYHSWDEDISEFEALQMVTATYNNDYPTSEIMLPEDMFDVPAINHMLLTATNFENETGEWIEYGNENFYYTLFDVTSVKDASDGPFSVYPNPFAETIRFSGAEPLQRFTLYDLQGRVVLQKQMNEAAEVNTGQLPAGMYVYQIEGTNTLQVGKLGRE